MTQDSKEIVCCTVDLGGTNLRAALVDSHGRIHERFKFKTPAADDADEIVSAISNAVNACSKQAAQSVTAVSVVVPGSVQHGSGIVVNAPNIPSLAGFTLGVALEKELSTPVLLENDANAAALGEMWKGASRDCQTSVCLTLGTGVGSGIILDRKLWRGIDGTGGEIGHTSVDPFGGVKCKCGNVGCLEVCASASAIVRMAREELTNTPQSSLHSILASELSSERISRAAIEGDELALGIFRKVGTYLGIAIANVVNTLNPEMIVIGGGVSASFDLFAARAREEMLSRAFPVPAHRCQIVKAECGDDAGLLGAAWLAFGVR
jgi:glucokinase